MTILYVNFHSVQCLLAFLKPNLLTKFKFLYDLSLCLSFDVIVYFKLVVQNFTFENHIVEKFA